MDVRALLEQIESGAGGEVPLEASIAYLAAQAVPFDEDELRGARRRALLVLAAGGDPRRELEVGGRAVSVLAADLDDEARRDRLGGALESLRRDAAGLQAVSDTIAALLADAELAWRWVCCALLAEELAEPG